MANSKLLDGRSIIGPRNFNGQTPAFPLTRICLFVEDTKQSMAKHNLNKGLIGNLGQEVDMLQNSNNAELIAAYRSW